MPNCFQLTRKSAPEKGPVKFTEIDDEMCKHFKADPHPTLYHAAWYDIFGLALAMGQTFESKRVFFRDKIVQCKDKPEEIQMWIHWIEIADWLEANFTPNAWYETKR